MKKLIFGLYALASYVVGMASLLYLCGFMVNFAVPKGIDGGTVGTLGESLLVNTVILIAFLVPHSIMARPGFKAWWTTIVPPAVERATYIAFSGITLLAALWYWQPIPAPVWSVQDDLAVFALYAVYGLGWAIIVISTFTIDHFSFFGLRQVWDFVRNRTPRPVPFTASWFYALVRHPINVGWMLVFWATPNMTVGHLQFAIGMVAYILIVTPIEERDLEAYIGDEYRQYRTKVRAFIPLRKTPAKAQPATAQADNEA